MGVEWLRPAPRLHRDVGISRYSDVPTVKTNCSYRLSRTKCKKVTGKMDLAHRTFKFTPGARALYVPSLGRFFHLANPGKTIPVTGRKEMQRKQISITQNGGRPAVEATRQQGIAKKPWRLFQHDTSLCCEKSLFDQPCLRNGWLPVIQGKPSCPYATTTGSQYRQRSSAPTKRPSPTFEETKSPEVKLFVRYSSSNRLVV